MEVTYVIRKKTAQCEPLCGFVIPHTDIKYKTGYIIHIHKATNMLNIYWLSFILHDKLQHTMSLFA